MRILIIEDDPLLSRGIAAALQRWTFEAETVHSCAAAFEALHSERFDAVLLDLQLPDGDGTAVLRALRRSKDTTPVLVITARDAVTDRINGLDAGADDYLVKPFHLDELAARLRSVHRRVRGLADSIIIEGRLSMDTISGETVFDGRPISLSPRELLLLKALAERVNRVVPRSILEAAVFGEEGVGSNALEVHVHALRRKLSRDAIQTVRGLGYILDPGVAT